jgi:hypothetical protein
MTEIEPIYSLKGKRVWVAGHYGMVGSALLPTPSRRRVYAVAAAALILVVSRSPE